MPKLSDIPFDKAVKAGQKALDELEKSGQEKKVVEIVSEKTGIVILHTKYKSGKSRIKP